MTPAGVRPLQEGDHPRIPLPKEGVAMQILTTIWSGSRKLMYLLSVCCALQLAHSLVWGVEPEGIACALTWKELAEIDQADFSIEHRFPLPGQPIQFLWSPADGSRLAIITRRNYLPTTSGHLLFFDLTKHRLLRDESLDIGVWNILKAQDGTGFVFMHGKEKTGRAPALMRVDGMTGDTGVRRELEALPGTAFLGKDDGVIVLLYYGARTGNQASTTARVELLVLSTLERSARLILSRPIGSYSLNLEIGRLHLMDEGVDDPDEPAIPGRLFIVDLEGKKLLTEADVGIAPGVLSWDEETGT
jgi:hypothetical protein